MENWIYSERMASLKPSTTFILSSHLWINEPTICWENLWEQIKKNSHLFGSTFSVPSLGWLTLCSWSSIDHLNNIFFRWMGPAEPQKELVAIQLPCFFSSTSSPLQSVIQHVFHFCASVILDSPPQRSFPSFSSFHKPIFNFPVKVLLWNYN